MRLPEIVRRFDIAATTITVGSASGGLLYVAVPPNLQLGPLAIQVSGEPPGGAVQASTPGVWGW